MGSCSQPCAHLRIKTWELLRTTTSGWDVAVGDIAQRATGNSVQVLDEDLLKLRRRLRVDDPLLTNWAEDGIELTGRPLRHVLHTATTLEHT